VRKIVVLGFLLVIGLVSFGQRSACEKANDIIEFAQKNHYSPRPIDAQFSAYVFSYFITSIDEHHLIFTAEDYLILSAFENKLSEEILTNQCAFIEIVDSLYFLRLNEIRALVGNIDATAIHFKADESIVFDEKRSFLPHKERAKQWTNRIKFQALSTHFSQIDSSLITATVSKLEIEQTLQSEICILDAALKERNIVSELYLDAIAMAFDPHTNYFSSDQKESFETGLSKETESYGIDIVKNRLEQIEIAYLLPGGPAWKSGLINEEDIILSVSDGVEKKSFLCVSLTDALNFINSPDHKTLIFEISKKNGQNKLVTLVKELVDVGSNVIQSYVLEGTKKIGYIYLPSFYSEMDPGAYGMPNGCANDIAKELFKLKREGIEGLIIDVRNNGGGSMLEAIRLSGIFIDYGAVAIMHHKDEKAQTLKDMDRGAAFSKPLVVMVNEFSASASEFFAAAMQDQNRAVIVGSTTFGKATMQVVLEVSENNFLKTTIGKFYRVNGKSHQLTGVVPDIALPSYYQQIKLNERAYVSALENKDIEHKTYYYPRAALPLEALKVKSKERLESNEQFKNVDVMAAYIYKQRNGAVIPLSIKAFKAYYVQRNLEYERLIESQKTKLYTVSNPSYLSNVRMKSDTDVLINKQVIEGIEKSIYISESYQIINDLINN